MTERIQKILANAGVASRRQIERWITAGRILVNGKPAVLGQPLVGDERVLLDGQPLSLVSAAGAERHLVYYKPVGEITTRADPEQRPTVFAKLPTLKAGRWISVGRLDINTSGLLLLTTDGALAHRLMHPSYELEREYAVRLLGSPTDHQLGQLAAGINLDDGPAHFEDVRRGGGTGRNEWVHVALREGRNREVRRMFDALGMTVSRLIRVRYGPIRLDRLQRGRSRSLTDNEIKMLYQTVDLPAPAPKPDGAAYKPRRSGQAQQQDGRRPPRNRQRHR